MCYLEVTIHLLELVVFSEERAVLVAQHFQNE